ncbi:MAG: cell wall-binding repeat-containing protein [Desulfitobacteriaceae bacterium]
MFKKKTKRFYVILLFLLITTVFPNQSSASTSTTPTSSTTSSQPTLNEISNRLNYWANQYNIPPAILKAIAWQESGWRQFDSSGNPLLSLNGVGIGIMQVSDSDFALYNLSKSDYHDKLMNDYDFNLSEGARILSQKWRIMPKMGDADRNKLENWYLAVWAYNGWSNKNNPAYAKAHGLIPYQDIIMALVGRKYNSAIVFTSPVTIPDPSLFPQAPLDQSFALATYAPSFLSTWNTPMPYHFGDLLVVPNLLLSAGGTTFEQANGDYWLNTTNGSMALNALGFYVTGYNSTSGSIKQQFAAKLETTGQTVYASAVTKLNNQNANLDLYSIKKSLWSIIQLPGISINLRQNAQTALSQVTLKVSKRLAGLTREDTAIAIAKEGWPQGTDTVVLVNSSDQSWADSVVAVPLAVRNNAPILLTPASSLPPQVLAELQNLHPQKIVLVGGSGVISTAIEQALKTSYQVTRYGGSDRYSTAVQVAQVVGIPSDGSAALVNGYAAPDAITVASLAGKAGQPILYTEANRLPKATDDFVKTHSLKALIIVGGTGVVPDGVLPKTTVNTRYGGVDRFATMLQVLRGYNPPIKNIFFAYGAGDSFADGLAGGPLVTRLGGILLYADHTAMDPKVATYLTQIRGYAMLDKSGGQIYEFGGLGALSIDDALNAALFHN